MIFRTNRTRAVLREATANAPDHEDIKAVKK